MRLDHYLVRKLPDQSRSGLSRYIRSGNIRVNNNTVKPSCKLRPGDRIQIEMPVSVENSLLPQPVDFEVLFEDQHLAVINKPPGLVVHPAAGHIDGTLVNGLLHRYKEMAVLNGDRPGIVHRLDKDTSGIILAARTAEMQRLLASAFKKRKIHKTYHALLLRSPAEMAGRITAPVGRHPVKRKKMAVRRNSGRSAITNWRIIERFTNGCCFMEMNIETGRTHQIRVHMASLNAPVVGDSLYGGKIIGRNIGIQADRQLLHASTLVFTHPVTTKECRFTAPLWPDMEQALAFLREKYSLAGQ